MFTDRDEAAYKLAEKLNQYRGLNPLILAIPRGAVGMAKIIADKLEGDFDVVLVGKLRAPYFSELAIGAVDESGWAYIADNAASAGADSIYLEAEKEAQLEMIYKRRAEYTPSTIPVSPTQRIVIVVDDGLATGATMIAALHSLRNKSPKELICAVPVAPYKTFKKIEGLADEVICLETPENFHAISQYYQNFLQVNDEEVIHMLQKRSHA